MNVTISSRGMDISPKLEELTRAKVQRFEKFVDGLESAEVHFFEEKNPRIEDKDVCEIKVDGHGHHLRCKVAGPNDMAAVDKAASKMEKQLRKLKTRLVNRHHHTGGKHDKHEEEVSVAVPELDSIKIVNKKSYAVDPMTAAEAVQLMEAAGHDFYMFMNIETGAPGTVYRRKAGDYGLLDQES